MVFEIGNDAFLKILKEIYPEFNPEKDFSKFDHMAYTIARETPGSTGYVDTAVNSRKMRILVLRQLESVKPYIAYGEKLPNAFENFSLIEAIRDKHKVKLDPPLKYRNTDYCYCSILYHMEKPEEMKPAIRAVLDATEELIDQIPSGNIT